MSHARLFVALAVGGALAAPAPALAKATKQDANFARSATSRALTEVDVARAFLRMHGDSRAGRRFASLLTKRSGHESRALIKLSTQEGVPPLATGKRRGTRQVAHLAKVSAAHRSRSFAKAMLSDLRSHLRIYDKELRRGHDAQVRRQARTWRPRLVNLIARARALA